MTGGIAARMAKGVVWVAAARVMVNAIAFISTILLARLLTPSDFGIVAIASAIAAIVTAVTELSMAEALIQHRDPTDEYFHSAWTMNMARSSVVGLLIAALALPIARLYGDPRLFPILIVVGIVTAMSGASNPQLFMFQRKLIFWQEFAFNVSQKMAGFVAAIAVAALFRSHWALVCGMVASQLCAIVVSYVLLPFRPKLRFVEARELLSFSVWLTLSRAVNMVNWRSDQLMIGYFTGATQLGFYTVGENLANLPTREALAPLTQTLFPGFSRLSHDMERLRAAYRRAHAILCAIAFPIGIGFAAVAPSTVLLLMGGKWLPSVPMVQVLSVFAALNVLTMPLQALAMATGNTRVLFGRDVRNLLIRIPFMLVGFWFGWRSSVGPVMGIIYAGAASATIGNLLNMVLVRRIIGVGVIEQLRSVWRTALGSVVMVLAALSAQTTVLAATSSDMLLARIAIGVAAGGLAYAATLIALWIAQGRPAGAEAEIVTLAGQVRQKFRPAAQT